MNYKNAFGFKMKEEDELNNFLLPNYDYLLTHYPQKGLRFDEGFYLNVFLKTLLFDLSIRNVKEFLEIQLVNCNNPDEFIQVLDLEVIPQIKTIIDGAALDGYGIGYYKSEKLEGDFVSSEGIIKNRNYDMRLFLHQTAFKKLSSKFERVIRVLTEYISDSHTLQEAENDLSFKWIAGPSQLAIIFIELINSGYVEAEFYRGELNKKKLAESLAFVFGIKEKYNVRSIEAYLNENGSKYSETRDKFTDQEFKIPSKRYTN
ncbi:MAG: hypothetical protein AB8B52_02325 [Winogradskyella sp.]|uniref:hypothetical protein n=1 Tax=Winogradskyella sp. TaxID=1883156 RepID=UPI00385C6AE1